MIDWDRVLQLRDEMGDDDFSEVVDLFLEEMQTEIGKLKTNTGAEDLEAMLHSLKGSALNLGFADFAEHCRIGEAQAREGRVDQETIENALSSYNATLPEYQELLTSLRSS